MKEGYLDFEEYIRQGEPDKKEKTSIWRTAIGLQAVDGLKTSDYLKDTARKHIEGEIDIDKARKLIKTYYQSRTKREPDDDDKQEADIPPLDQRSLATKGAQEIPEQVPEQVADLLHTNNTLVIDLIKKIGNESVSISQLMKLLELKHRPNFLEYHLKPAMKEGYVRMLYPESPRHPRQKYLLTMKGMALYNELTKSE